MPTADKQSWIAFLDLLKKNRPRQPINGVIVAISLEDLMTLDARPIIAAHANAIRARLLELHERLKVDFPVYALFTKGDLVAGFMEYFGEPDRAGPPPGLGRDLPDRRQDAQSWSARCRSSMTTLSSASTTTSPTACRTSRRRARAFCCIGFPAQMARAQAADLRFSQPDLRADPLSRQCDPARISISPPAPSRAPRSIS